MIFAKELRDRVRCGEITLSVRIWLRPKVKVGGVYALAPGHVRVTGIREIPFAAITPELARRSGFAGVVDLLKTAKHGPGERVFVVAFVYEE
jgi:hypothetical protein